MSPVLAAALAMSSCGQAPSGNNGPGHDSGSNPGGAISCSATESYNTANWVNACGSERWSIKVGNDPDVGNVNMVPQSTTIGALGALAAPATPPDCNRVAPTEDTVYELKNVQLKEIKLENDSDYHLVLSDGSSMMIAEIPYPGCDTKAGYGCNGTSKPYSRFDCFLTHARGAVDKKLTPAPTWTTVGQTVTVIGVGFFDLDHGQTGAAPNYMELHPILAICFGQDCDPLST